MTSFAAVGNALRGVPFFRFRVLYGGRSSPSWNAAQRNATEGVPYSRPSALRRGVSLLEVLASIGVLSIGLLGLAALLPIGRYTLAEATKADRAGQCGRAALRDITVRRMLDYHNWYDPLQGKFVGDKNNSKAWYDPNGNPTQNLPSAFIIDPLGVTNGLPAYFGNPPTNYVRRITLGNPATGFVMNNTNTTPMADAIFRATDDLIIPMPEDLKPPQPAGRPQNLDINGKANPLDYAGAYSWFLTVVPVPNNATRFTVSVVVCFNRNLTTNPAGAAMGERAVPVTTFFDQAAINKAPVAIGGGSILLNPRPINDIQSDATASPPTVAGISLKENDWVALCSPTNGLCRWYRVAAIGDNIPGDTGQFLTLIGPDWVPTPGKDQLIALGQSVIGVYTTTVDLDTDTMWKN